MREALDGLMRAIKGGPENSLIPSHVYFYVEYGPRWRERVPYKQHAPSSVAASALLDDCGPVTVPALRITIRQKETHQ
jgi:hypothetical protein